MMKGIVVGFPAVLLVAQAAADPSAVAASWMASGLGGGIIAWLLFRYLPAKDAQRDALDKTHDGHVEALARQASEERKAERERFAEVLSQQRYDFAAALAEQRKDLQAGVALIVQQQKESTVALTGAMARELASLTTTVATLGKAMDQSRIQYEALTQRNPQ